MQNSSTVMAPWGCCCRTLRAVGRAVLQYSTPSFVYRSTDRRNEDARPCGESGVRVQFDRGPTSRVKLHSDPAFPNRAITQGVKLVDNLEANAGNINSLPPRLDGVRGFIRVTLDPTQSHIISAGLQSAGQVLNGLKNGRFTPFQ